MWELDRLGGAPEDGSDQVRVVSGTSSPVAERQLAALDERFRELRENIEVSKAFVPESEDEQMSAWLAAGLEAWIKEHDGAEENLFVTERLSRRNPSLHASLRMITDARTERQRRWAFRAIAADHHKAVQSRLRKAVAEAGLGAEGTERQLFVLRNTPWPSGPVTERETAEFTAKGGIALAVTGEDLKTFGALKEMLVKPDPELRGWLIVRQPAHRTELLSRTLGDAVRAQQSGQAQEAAPALVSPSRDRPQLTAASGTSPAIRVGTTAVGQMPVSLDLASLRRHVSVFAGAGSGKTVLLRRIIEECALHGVSSIVLDPNNDLARLGDAWPQPPETWGDDDAERARDYLENTDVVIWTPGVDGGRPLSFQPLSVFTDVLDDMDNFRAAVDAAVEVIAPQVNAHRDTVASKRDKAVLTEALWHFARGGGSNLDEFVSLLSDLPDDASTLTKATTIAAELADRLRSARVNDRLFAGSGEPVDPGILLCPPPDKLARVSVVSLAGLPGLEQRQSFVNQLQIALFSWIKRHPAADRPLGGLFVMDEAQEFAPSGRGTPCRASTLRLVAQARKYGLGMLFATQQPKGLQNSIPNNSTTQFYGLLLAGAQVDTARELARVKGGDVPDIGRLKAGQFYIGTEGSGFRKIRTSMCLSYHPTGPLAEEEVIKRASGK